MLDNLIEAAMIGDYSTIEGFIKQQRLVGDQYAVFCDKIEGYIKQYKGDEIVVFIKEKGANI